jgi:hypothetical protein
MVNDASYYSNCQGRDYYHGWSMMQATIQIVREEITIIDGQCCKLLLKLSGKRLLSWLSHWMPSWKYGKIVSYVSVISAQCNVQPIKIKKYNIPFSLYQAALLIVERANVKTSTKEKSIS